MQTLMAMIKNFGRMSVKDSSTEGMCKRMHSVSVTCTCSSDRYHSLLVEHSLGSHRNLP